MCAVMTAVTAGCATPHSGGFPAAGTAPIERAITAVIAEKRMPGAVFRLEQGDRVDSFAAGNTSYDDGAPAVTGDTIFDVASLTKVMATAPSVLVLVEQGRIDLDAPVARYFPECGGGEKDAILVRHLLTHTSGLKAGIPAKPAWEGPDAAHALACAAQPTHPPGTYFRYSDINYILLGRLVEAVSGERLDGFAERHLFRPLGMRDTSFLPLLRGWSARIAPTQADRRGEVHDPTVHRMGGVGGAAGLFSTAADVARFARMLLAGGELDGVRVLSANSVRLLTTAQTPAGIPELRAMGMDIDSPFARPRGSIFPVGSYGHTGFTGCFMWVDPRSRTFYVFLSNRVYPDGSSNILSLYGQLGTLAAGARVD